VRERLLTSPFLVMLLFFIGRFSPRRAFWMKVSAVLLSLFAYGRRPGSFSFRVEHGFLYSLFFVQLSVLFCYTFPVRSVLASLGGPFFFLYEEFVPAPFVVSSFQEEAFPRSTSFFSMGLSLSLLVRVKNPRRYRAFPCARRLPDPSLFPDLH